MVTLGIPGKKFHDVKDIDILIAEYRKFIVGEFHRLRERKIWKESVDGGMWFFEVVINLEEGGVKLHPHLHMVLLCSKMLPIVDLNEYVAGPNGIALGRFHVSTPRNPNGTIKKAKPADAINYCMSYLKKEEQLDGRNRQTFGTMYK